MWVAAQAGKRQLAGASWQVQKAGSWLRSQGQPQADDGDSQASSNPWWQQPAGETAKDSRKRPHSPEPEPEEVASSSSEDEDEDDDDEEEDPDVEEAVPVDSWGVAGQAARGAWGAPAQPRGNAFANFGANRQQGQRMMGRGTTVVQQTSLQRTASGSTFEAQVFRCAACRVDSSGQTSYLQHIQGKKHLMRTNGKAWGGLLPNDAGVIPTMTRQMATMLGMPQLANQQQQVPQMAVNGKGKASLVPPKRQAVGGVPSGVVRHLQLTRHGEDALQKAWYIANQRKEAAQREAVGADTSAALRQQQQQQRRSRWGPRVPPQQRVEGGPLRQQREALPVFSMRAELMRAIRSCPVVVVEGETGSGKTTQIPQYILEEAAAADEPCSIVCTQPRRISAIGVADRVAEERGERTGGLVGYSVRLENSSTEATQLLFVTTGILLRRLEEDPELTGTTHVIVDEVHERAEESDFLLLALRSLLRRRQQLRVVLMSATLDTKLFSKYFDGAPIIQVSGRTYPVKTLFLEDALRITGHVVRPGADWAVGGGKGKGKGGQDGRDKQPEHPPEDFSPEALKQRYRDYGPQVMTALKMLDHDAVNYELVTSLIQMAVTGRLAPEGKHMGAVLVFLSGVKEISTLHDEVLKLPEFRQEPQRSWVVPLHGSLPSEEQRRVFASPPEGVFKVVLATNVAETSITINDVGVVIDTARMKENSYDGARRVASLEDVIVARSNAKQRRGRAGRVASGVAVHLITKFRHDSLIPDRRLPEVQRVPLQQLVLRIHSMKISVIEEQHGSAGRNAADVCSGLLEPPAPEAVRKAVDELVEMDALSIDIENGREALTPLGSRLATLPVDARIGKLILLGAVFGERVLDHALTIAAALTLGSLFMRPWDKRDEADKIRARFAERLGSDLVGASDHLSTLLAYCEADSLRGAERSNFCRDNMLGMRSLTSMGALKRQLLEHLSDAGFVRQGLRAKTAESYGRYDGSDGVRAVLMGSNGYGAPSSSIPQPDEVPLLAALLCAALFPQVARVTLPKVSQRTKKFGKGVDPQHMKIHVQVAGQEERARLHPSSVAARASKAMSGFIVYHELVKTTQLYVRDVTQLPPMALLLFGGALKQEGKSIQKGKFGEQVVLSVGGSWVRFAVPARMLDALYTVRGQLDQLLRKRTEQGLNRQPSQVYVESQAQQDNQLLQAVSWLVSCLVEDSDEEEEDQGHHKSKKWGGWGGGGGKKNKGNKQAQKARRKYRGR